jgi:hypothetical protein
MRWIVFVALTLGCAPRDVVPSAPEHPANPNATTRPHPAATGTPEQQAAELAAYQKAKPVFDKFCAKCHATSGAKSSAKKLGHFDMTSYPFGGHHADYVGLAVRQTLGVEGGKEATMPDDDPGAVKGADLDAIVAWSRAFDDAHPGAANHRDDDDDDGDKGKH